MKKIYGIIAILALTLGFTACSDDNDSNPTLNVPDSFVLNTPPYAGSVYDLTSSTSLELTTSQPDYGYTAAVVYAVQVSLTDTWTDEETYQELSTTSTQTIVDADAVEMAKAIVKLSGWTSETDFDGNSMDVYVRLRATLASGEPTSTVYSNAVKLTVLPYYIELTDAMPNFYFLIGGGIGDGKWTNALSSVGLSTIPMSLVPDYEYDAKTGNGKFTYTVYLQPSTDTKDNSFKVIGLVNGAMSWDEQWGASGSGLVHNDNGDNINVSEAGWYRLDADQVAGTLTMTQLDAGPANTYSSMQLLGEFSDWDGNPVEMTLTDQHEHTWWTKITFAENTEVKFRANNSWDVSWGGDAFPFAVAAAGGSNINAKAGTYIVVFNDIEGSYAFFAQE